MNGFWFCGERIFLHLSQKRRIPTLGGTPPRIFTVWAQNVKTSNKLISMGFKDNILIHGAKDIFFLQKFRKSTFGQHLGNICCLNVALKALLRQKMSKTEFFYWSLRQHLGNKCCLNADQMLPNYNFIKNRCLLHQKIFS